MNQMPLYRALLPRDLVAGLPRSFLLILVASTTIIVGAFNQVWFLLVAGISCLVMRALTKRDPYLVEAGLVMLMEPGRLEV